MNTDKNSTKKNIFVVGLDDFNLEELKTLRHVDEYAFHPLLSYKDLEQAEGGSFEKLMEKACAELEAFDGSIDAVIAFWDFPAEAMAPLLCKRYGLPSPSIESVEKCEHKYWSRVEQQKVVSECVPKFRLVNPSDKDIVGKFDLPYPFWLKPVKSFSSYLGFRIENDNDFEEALTEIRAHIDDIAEPYNELLAHVDRPPEIQQVDGHYCIAEEIISGDLFSLEGYAQNGEVTIYGVIDTLRTENDSTLSRLQYPSKLPEDAQQRAIEAAKKVMKQFGFDHGAFNFEFFYNRENDRLWLLEINPRISQSHCELFHQVDGDSHQEVPIDLKLGIKPRMPHRQGSFPLAAKYYLRHEKNEHVERIPSEQDIEKLEERFPETRVKITVEQGKNLSDKLVQDSYSFEIANIYLGAENEEALLDKLEQCIAMLPFEFSPAQEKKQKTA